jgi:hypothetical protein
MLIHLQHFNQSNDFAFEQVYTSQLFDGGF